MTSLMIIMTKKMELLKNFKMPKMDSQLLLEARKAMCRIRQRAYIILIIYNNPSVPRVFKTRSYSKQYMKIC